MTGVDREFLRKDRIAWLHRIKLPVFHLHISQGEDSCSEQIT